jgi:2',3'-cyclic-nucleotide 2'-phosphodiesterase (5'-nucleotidase family)
MMKSKTIAMKKLISILFICIFTSSAFYVSAQNEKPLVTFLHINDLYEITPLEGGKFGGPARVETFKKHLNSSRDNLIFIISGDFISPSALGTGSYEGKRINGKQMIDVLNHMNLDYAVFGNHEFDVKYDVLKERMDESNFTWFGSNVFHRSGDTVKKFTRNIEGIERTVPDYLILNLETNDNKFVKIGILGVTITSNKAEYVHYIDPLESAIETYSMIKDSVDYMIAITHLSIEDDKELAKRLPELKLIMGGHEHVNMYDTVGSTFIAKADANVRTVYVHDLYLDDGNNLNVVSELHEINSSIRDDSLIAAVVTKWVDRAYAGFRADGFEPDQMVTILKDTLDGREITVRFKQNKLGDIIAEAMMKALPGTELSFFNSGSIRIDDELFGEVTQYDIIRVLPFGGKILKVELKGDLLEKVLDAGLKNTGLGGYLLYSNIKYDEAADIWLVNGVKLQPDKIYVAAVADYLLTGMEYHLEFLTPDNPGIIKITQPGHDSLANDIRLAVISYLRNGND